MQVRNSIIVLLLATAGMFAQNGQLKLGLLKYSGGGDWYANPSALGNLAAFTNQQLGSNFSTEYEVVPVGSSSIFDFPFIHMTGHGNVVFSNEEAQNLRTYLEAGGFLHIDDNYGMDKFIRPELARIFPESELKPIPASHPIYRQYFKFEEGLPKVHEHDQKPPQGYGIFINDRLAIFYTYESDLSDGWEDPEIHNDPPEVREKALKMGASILEYVFKGQPIQ